MDVGVKRHNLYKLVDINHRRRYKKYEPFFLAMQATQVCYVLYPSKKKDKDDWAAVLKVKPQNVIELPNEEVATISEVNVPFQVKEVEVHEIDMIVSIDENILLNDPNGDVIEMDEPIDDGLLQENHEIHIESTEEEYETEETEENEDEKEEEEEFEEDIHDPFTPVTLVIDNFVTLVTFVFSGMSRGRGREKSPCRSNPVIRVSMPTIFKPTIVYPQQGGTPTNIEMLEPSQICSSFISKSFKSDVDPNGINWKSVSTDVRNGYFGEFKAIEKSRDPTPIELHLHVHTLGHDGKSFVGKRSRSVHVQASITPFGNPSMLTPIVPPTTNVDELIKHDNRLLDRNGIQQRRNSWQDGVYGTNCPIPPGQNFTYVLQVKDQIGSFFYFPSLAMHKAAGGYGGIIIRSRPLIPIPFPPPTGDYTILVGDWFKQNHTDLKAILDGGNDLPFPDGLLVNGRGSNGLTFTVDQGRTYRFRISNVGLTTAINFRIQGHKMVLVEVEGTHTLQNTYESLDIHLGQSYSVLVTMDQPGQDYYIVASTRFTSPVLTATSILHYSNSAGGVSGPPPGGPTIEIDWSLNQARSVRQNLTASGPRPNPQGSYHYGLVNTTRTIRLANSAPMINGKKRYAVNSVSFIPADTPLKLADYFKIPGVFNLGSIQDYPTGGGGYLQTSVMAADFRAYVEIVFENPEDTVQSWHIDGHIFFVVGMDGGQWSAASRLNYNLRDGISRCTIQVYPRSWTALYMPLDNVGMWNIRSENWARQYLGQQFYLRVYSPVNSWRDEYPIPIGALLCGRASGRKTRPL
ncbi:L-ascorbate oxidase homolog [Solanum stenotomum]|uniref:L-ascorbate oxidase homolog n=1 Tax=Solanum stenotomum TaxID=172797 RepID=UPI0020D143F5|nr:L-ascorbate oxidase homolog [Solanum stenotomum]